MTVAQEHLTYASQALEATRKARKARARHRALSIAATAITVAEARRLLPYVISAHGDTPGRQQRRRVALAREVYRRKTDAA